MFIKKTIILLVLFSINCLVYSNNNTIFASWIERTCKPFDKGKLTALPHFYICQHNIINVSNMLKYEELPTVNSERWLSLEDLEGEEWARMTDYGGGYSVSNYGRIKSHDRLRRVNNYGGVTIVKGRIMKLTLNKTRGGYWYVSFHLKSGEPSIKEHVHALVAKYFVSNPHNLPCVNHKDENSHNNIFENLEWCDYAYNNAYGTARARSQKTRIKNGIAKAVGRYDSKGKLVQKYISLGEAQKDTGIHKSTISTYCRNGMMGRDKHYYKFINS